MKNFQIRSFFWSEYWKIQARKNTVFEHLWPSIYKSFKAWIVTCNKKLLNVIRDKVFLNGPGKICGRLPKADHNPSNFLKAGFHNVYLVHSWILCCLISCCCPDKTIYNRLIHFNCSRVIRYTLRLLTHDHIIFQ